MEILQIREGIRTNFLYIPLREQDGWSQKLLLRIGTEFLFPDLLPWTAFYLTFCYLLWFKRMTKWAFLVLKFWNMCKICFGSLFRAFHESHCTIERHMIQQPCGREYSAKLSVPCSSWLCGPSSLFAFISCSFEITEAISTTSLLQITFLAAFLQGTNCC